MIDPKLHAYAVLLAELWWQQYFNGNPSPLAEALEPVSALTPELSALYKLVLTSGDFSEVKRLRIEANEALQKL